MVKRNLLSGKEKTSRTFYPETDRGDKESRRLWFYLAHDREMWRYIEIDAKNYLPDFAAS